ncbi:uncharacterized protein [Coffea arabica]|uniref:Uncharacterized protein n=1 Tax=Coffea arabica TaxID=13443 RepID=A0A6P6UGE6_COFAR|nr:uncharacterized protein LOC113710609 [Coffea arabica]
MRSEEVAEEDVGWKDCRSEKAKRQSSEVISNFERYDVTPDTSDTWEGCSDTPPEPDRCPLTSHKDRGLTQSTGKKNNGAGSEPEASVADPALPEIITAPQKLSSQSTNQLQQLSTSQPHLGISSAEPPMQRQIFLPIFQQSQTDGDWGRVASAKVDQISNQSPNHEWCEYLFTAIFIICEEEARKALESALGGKKTEFEKWDKELKRREQAGGGGNSGRGGWFRWFGGSDDDHFWEEAQQTSLTILGIIGMYLIIAKGDLMIAVVLNPLLFLLRGTRNGLTFLTTLVREKLNSVTNPSLRTVQQRQISAPVSARESVMKKWGSS